MFVPAKVTKLRRLEPGDLRLIELTLPTFLTIDGKEHPIQDGLRPGSEFWIKPLNEHREKRRQRVYFRSNCSINAHGVLETIITDTYDQSDTWSWWRTERIEEGDAIGVRVDADIAGPVFKIYELKNLALEPDIWWPEQDFVAVAFSTGISLPCAYSLYGALRIRPSLQPFWAWNALCAYRKRERAATVNLP
jgi:hypothetical protein